MTPVRWVVEHPGHEFAAGGWVEYPDESTARTHAGTAATVWALVPAEAVRVIEAARAVVAGWTEEPDITDTDWLSDESVMLVGAMKRLAQQETP